ncbi:MAG: ABC transporter permease [Acholeplasmataceae bacterium]
MKNNKLVVKIKDKIVQIISNAYDIIKPSLIAIAVGLFIGFIIMLMFDVRDAVPAMITLIFGSFIEGSKSFGNMLDIAGPIILAGLSVAFAFKTGLFNIGASGQMMMGTIASLYVGIAFRMSFPLHLILSLLAGLVAGAIWGFIPGILKATRNVNEVVSSIMMNYVALYLFTLVIKLYLSQGTGSSSTSRPVAGSATLPRLTGLFPDSTANYGIFIAIGIVIIAHIIIHKTTLGFSLRASGFSFDGSKYAGMKTKTNIVIAMTMAGLFAGVGGSILYLVQGKTIADFHIFTEGFDGISVALLGMGEPIGALLAGLFLANIRQGAFYLQLYVYVDELIDMIIAIIIYSIAITAAVQLLLKRYGTDIKIYFKKRKKKKAEAKGSDLK